MYLSCTFHKGEGTSSHRRSTQRPATLEASARHAGRAREGTHGSSFPIRGEASCCELANGRACYTRGPFPSLRGSHRNLVEHPICCRAAFARTLRWLLHDGCPPAVPQVPTRVREGTCNKKSERPQLTPLGFEATLMSRDPGRRPGARCRGRCKGGGRDSRVCGGKRGARVRDSDR